MHKSLTHKTEIQVRFSECDPLQIVWHGNYVKYFEDGREAFGRAYHFTYLQIHAAHGLSVPLVHLEMDYKKTLSFGEKIVVETTMIDNPAAKIVFEYKIFNEAGEIVCTGKTIQAFVNTSKKELQISTPPFFETWKKENLR